MQWFLNYLTSRFQTLYEVNGTVSVDESMIKFRGRLSFSQYLPMKPTKWGIMVWVMAESSTGYVTNVQVYCGREGKYKKGLAHRVVMDLARPYYGSYLSIYIDNFYTGVELLEDMKSHGNLTFCIWQVTKTVMVLSNHYDPTETGTVNRRREGAGQSQVTVPSCLANYQKYMKGVNLLDQMDDGFQR
ncbi:unnamed protein product [Knipowitschia caucasica]